MSGQSRALVLGGTRFVGLHLARRLVETGWDVTLFNRGHSAPDAVPGAATLIGDRSGDVSALASGTWDVVFDVNAYLPDQVRRSGELLRDSCGHYVYVSTVSVYDDLTRAGLTEDDPISTWDGPHEVSGESYGPLKAMCERVAAELFTDLTVVRPSVVAGPYDHTDRFTYWVARVGDPGPRLVPDALDNPVQYVDARDLAAFVELLGGNRTPGVFNAAVPSTTFGALLEGIAEALDTPLRLAPVPYETLLAADVHGWQDVPLYLPPEEVRARGLLQVDTTRATAAGLTVRPLADTVRDTHAWWEASGRPQPSCGLTPDREAELVRRLT